jgi:hypothetical protein
MRAAAAEKMTPVNQRIRRLASLCSRNSSSIVCALLLLLSAACMTWSFCLAYREVDGVYVMVPAASGMLFAAFARLLDLES